MQFSAYILNTPAEDIMNDPALQGTYTEAAVLAHLQVGLYIPHQANEGEAETFQASQYATIQGRR